MASQSGGSRKRRKAASGAAVETTPSLNDQDVDFVFENEFGMEQPDSEEEAAAAREEILVDGDEAEAKVEVKVNGVLTYEIRI
jgi:hypothetical protein